MTNERYNLIQLTCIFLRVEHIKTNCEVLYMCSDYFHFPGDLTNTCEKV